MTLSGTWVSKYKHHGDEIGLHEVTVSKSANDQYKVEGLGEDDSTLSMLLVYSHETNTLTGTWEEHTSLNGLYKGAVFHGAVQFVLNNEFNLAKGKWVGFNQNKTKINSGEWELEKK